MVNLENYEEYMLLEADGELTESEQKALHAFIERHPELKNELALFEAVKLTPDTSLVYEGKEELMKTVAAVKTRTIGLGSWKTYAAIAACATIALLLLLKPDGTEVEIPVTATTTTNTPVKTDNNNSTHVATTTTTGEDLHSTPKDPVAIETKKVAVKATTIKKQPPAIDEPVPVQVVANETPKPTPVIAEEPRRKEIKPESAEEQYARTEQLVALPNSAVEPVENHGNRKLIAFAPVEEKFDGLSDIKDAVNNKIEKVKNIRGKIKDTDIQVRFGKTELFTVKL